MNNQYPDLLLLLASLSSIENEDHIRRIFMESMEHAYPSLKLKYASEIPQNNNDYITLPGKGDLNTYLIYSHGPEVSSEVLSVLHNAAGILTTTLQNLKLKSELESKNRELEEKYQDSQSFIANMASTVPVMLYIYNMKTASNVYINHSVGSILGYDEKQIQDMGSGFIAKICHPDDFISILDHHTALRNLKLGEKKDLIYRLKDKNGEWHHIQSRDTPYRKDENGITVEILGCAWDNTEKVNQEILYAATFNQAAVGVFVTDDQGRLVQINKTFSKLLHTSEKNLISSYIKDFIEKKDAKKLAESLNKITRGEHRSLSQEFYISGKDKTDKWLKITLSPMQKRGGEIENVIGILEDISQTKKDQAELAALNLSLKNQYSELLEAKKTAEESNRLKTAFIQNMSHEIRTPLNGMVGFAELLSYDQLTQEERQSYSNMMVESSYQLLNIVNDILDISRMESGEIPLYKEDIEVTSILNSLIQNFTSRIESKGLQFIIKPPENLKSIILNTDSTRVQQIITNFMDNALKFTYQGSITLEWSISGKNLLISVKDSGIGIDKKYHEAIFERFRQVQMKISDLPGGNGLGLAICKNLAEILGGHIEMESEKDKGAVFTLIIPFKKIVEKKKQVDEKKSGSSNITLPKRDISILIAEDNAMNHMLLKTILSRSGYEISSAYNGKQAVEEAEKNPDIDYILMDIKMPIMSGADAMKKIKKSHPSIKIIAQTAFAMVEDRKKYLEMGFDGYISKPIKAQELFKLLESLSTSKVKSQENE